MALLRKHRDEQDQDRANAAQLWQGGDWLFATPTGGPVNPRIDYDEWKRLLRLAGLRMAGCMTPGTPQPRCCSSSASPKGP
jgi:integrase